MHGMRAFNLDSGNRLFVRFSRSPSAMGEMWILQLFQGQFALMPQAAAESESGELMFFA